MSIPDTSHTPSVEEYIASLKNSKKFGPQVVSHRIFPDIEAIYYSDQSSNVSDEIIECLNLFGLERLYEHQGSALGHIKKGKNIIVATATSSGKSMVYNLPVLENLFKNRLAKALYIFPLKALSQDQFRKLAIVSSYFSKIIGVANEDIASIYDGDTKPYARRKIREKTPPILITNPEMLHLSLLPFHESWAHFFKNLAFIVIDEVHTYRGVFGSHFSWLIRRLKRICQYYGSDPVFILSSATIGNPKEFAEKIIDDDVEMLQLSGAPQSKKNFIMLNPWDSAAYTASQLLEASIKRGLRTIVYTQSRKMTELITLWTRPKLGHIADKLSSYRAGFLPEERREIEAKLTNGELLGVISTSALELGIDIGDLDICILVGYPGSIMASWQRGGRVGRAGRESAVIMIGSEDALDQYYMKNPKIFFDKQVESAVVNPKNKKILKDHLNCAAAEIPLSFDEEILQKKYIQITVDEMVGESILLQSADGEIYYSSRKRPQRNISLRGSGETLTIINSDTGVILGDIDAGRALKECHEGAIYLHQVNTWLVSKLDLMAREVVVAEKKVPYFTKPMSNKDTEILETYEIRNVYGCLLSFGMLKVTEKVTGYQKRNSGTNRLMNTIPLDLPEQVMETIGFWLEIPTFIVDMLQEDKYHFMGGLHALEHLLISVFPLFVLCDRNDVGGISCPHHQQTNEATIFVYDGHPGGSGLAEDAFKRFEGLLLRAQEIIGSCECENGCPACVHSPKCGSGNRPIDKSACKKLLSSIMAKNAYSENSSTNDISCQLQKTIKQKRANAVRYVKDIPDIINVLPEHYGVFDLETKFSADEVGGWHRIEKMQVSAAVVYDSVLDGYVTYLEDEIDGLVEHLLRLDLVVGFNNKRFDNRVLSHYTEVNLHAVPTIDLLEEIHNHLGYRLSLNGVAEHTLGVKKSGDGLQALEWYRQGKIDVLVKYCKKDVEITKNLFLHGLEHSYFIFKNKAGKKVRLPLNLERAVLSQLENR